VIPEASPIFDRFLIACALLAAASSCFAQSSAPAVFDDFAPFVRNRNDPAVTRGEAKVAWRALNAETLALAARANKPIFLFITATWCRSGRIMDRVTFSDPEVATRLNEEFIPVRLDRDQRPDVDVRMQQAVQLIAGVRGWPLVACLTPEGRPFFGGTFFSAEDDLALSRSGLRTTLFRLSRSWRDERPRAAEKALMVEQAMHKSAAELPPPAALRDDFFDSLARQQQDRMLNPPSEKSGAARFPEPATLELLLRHFRTVNDPRSLEAARANLDAMLTGAIYDHLEGGFHRFCIDRHWRVPRFEKVAFVNAEMARLCALAFQSTDNLRHRQAAEETLRLWDAELSDKAGEFFCSSLAADFSDTDDGDYFTWTLADAEQVLRDDADCKLARLYFGIEETGDLPLTGPERNILYQHLPLPKAAALAGIPTGQADERLRQVRAAMLHARRRRPSPPVDKTAFVDANALLSATFIESGRILTQKQFVDRGLKTLRALLKSAIVGAGENSAALHAIGQQHEPANALAQDEAALAWACAVAFDVTRDEFFAAECEKSLQRLEKFWDKKNGGYFDRCTAPTSNLPLLNVPMKSCLDSSEPSANILAARALVKLGALKNNPAHLKRAGEIVITFTPILDKGGPYAASLYIVADDLKQLQAK
jgi:uncharacterized protein